jgi:predicted ArsR family transcriptional regulator
MTVEELARAIGITDNAVRLHLAALERDGLARAIGVRREGTVGKPATIYAVTAEAEAAFSKAYEPVLTTLLVTLGGRLGEADLSDLLRDVGRQLASSSVSQDTSLEQRVRAAAGVLDALGAETDVEPAANGGYVVRGFACPLSRSVAQCPPLCGAVEELVAGITKAKVEERCDRSETPRCTFLVTPAMRPRRVRRAGGD